MSEKNLLEIKDLHVNVEDKEILHGVNLEVGKDEVHVLMGPNGTGKSTLGYAITGHPKYAITSGQIFFDGLHQVFHSLHLNQKNAPESVFRCIAIRT